MLRSPVRTPLLALCFLVLGCTGGDAGGGVTTPVEVATVSVSPGTATVLPGQTQQLTATLRDALGGVLTGSSVLWASDDPATASVDQTGLVRGRAEGPVRITASSGGRTGSAIISVAPAPVAFVTVQPDTVTLTEGGTRNFTVVLHDADRKVLSNRVVEWSSSDPEIASVDPSGFVHTVGPGTATLRARSEGITGTATITVVSPFTDVRGTIQANTTWTRARSPYRLTGTVQVAPGATLTIEPGVTVFGGGLRRFLDVLGTVRAVGTPGNRITLEGIVARTDTAGVLHVEHAHFFNGGYGPVQDRSGAFILRNSVVETSAPLHVRYPRADVFIERNLFVNAGGIVAGSDQGRVYVRNNHFGRAVPGSGAPAALEVWHGPAARYVVQHNTFAETAYIALLLDGQAPDLVAAENYWGTTDETVIESMIYDSRDDPARGTVEYRPFLTSPHPGTPEP
jgi:hypothetical protein